MLTLQSYKPQQFDLSRLTGISEQTLEMHFKLYEGYVQNTNVLTEKIAEILKDGKIDHEEMPAYSELTRNGDSDPGRDSDFRRAAEASFGRYDIWKADFIGIGKMRGVGWAICYRDPANGRLSNHWITLHEVGNVSGFTPLLVMGVWEHAFLLDYKPAERPQYIEAFFANVDWQVVEERMRVGTRGSQKRVAST